MSNRILSSIKCTVHFKSRSVIVLCSKYTNLTGIANLRSVGNYNKSHIFQQYNRCSSLSSRESCQIIKTSTLVQKFEALASTEDLKTLSEHPICQQCIDKLQEFEDDELFKIIRIMDSLGDVFFRKHFEYKMLYVIALNLDNECGRRGSKSWDLPTIINVLENTRIFHRIKKRSKFLLLACYYKRKKAFYLPLPLLIKYLRIVNFNWYKVKSIGSKYHSEYALQIHFDDIKIQDLPLFFRAFNGQNMFVNNDKLLKNVFEKVVANVASLNDTALREFLIFINGQNFIFEYEAVTPLVETYLKYVSENHDKIRFDCLCYSIALSAKFLLYCPDLLIKVYDRIMNDSSLELTDHFEVAVHTFAFFNFRLDNVDIYRNLMDLIETDQISNQFFRNRFKRFVHVITYLSFTGHYSFKLINQFLSEEFLKNTYKKINIYTVDRHILQLNEGIRIEYPNCEGPRLKPEYRDNFLKFVMRVMPLKVMLPQNHTFETWHKQLSENSSRKFFLYERTMNDAASVLDTVFGGPEYTEVCFVLPHLPGRNLIFCTDSNKKPQKLPASIQKSVSVDINNLDKNLFWYVLVCSSRNRWTQHEPRIVDTEIPKVRQLKLLGARVINVVHEDWEIMDENEKRSILEELIILS